MAMPKGKRNTEVIVELAKQKSIKTREKAESAIARLSVQGKEINFNIVSKEAGVAKSWLYKNEAVRRQIEAFRANTARKNTGVQRGGRTQRLEGTLTKTLKDRVKELEKENRELKIQLEKLYGQLYQNKL